MPVSKPDEAVSNTVGFIIISGILLTSVALVFVIGLPVYNKYVDQSHMQNMIEGFDLISENGNNVALFKTPYQQSELKLYGGTITLRNAGDIHIDYYTDETGTEPCKIGVGDSITLGILEYSKDDTSLAYLLGGVFRKDTYSYPVIKNPPIYTFTDKYGPNPDTPVLVIPLIELNYKDFTMTGTTLARISFSTFYRYQKSNPDVSQPSVHTYNNVKHIKVTITSGDVDYNKCLLEYFEDELGFAKTSGTNNPLVMEKTYTSPTTGITVNTLPTTEIVTINSGST
ncbi:DUF7289 family protein [Methanocella sp. MCL-LM]|uniref:DUF7289 family protein n=1 Tax=Methanocella sp. MCL-LM TaxID=3412035 RepID=UPI003C71E822